MGNLLDRELREFLLGGLIKFKCSAPGDKRLLKADCIDLAKLTP